VTPWFQSEWKRYNITKVKTLGRSKEIDRLGKLHGKYVIRNDHGVVRISNYIQDKLHGQAIVYINGIKRKDKTYVNGIQQGPSTHYSDDQIVHKSYINGKLNGFKRIYRTNGGHMFGEYKNGILEGKVYQWHPNGGLADIYTYSHLAQRYRRINIDITGRKREEFTMHTSRLEGPCLVWDCHGKLIEASRYRNGFLVSPSK
jgi:antitoxin component YwqK of YwqJK toxin-antitoxin module